LDLAVESAIAQRFAGIEELYPTVEGVRRLDAERQELLDQLQANSGVAGRAKENTAVLRDLDLIDHALDVQTRRLMRRRLQEIDLNIEAERKQGLDPPEAKGIRRMQRIVRARLKLLDRIEAKIAKGRPLDLTETRFVERMGTAIAGRSNISGRDALIEQLDY